MIKNVYIVNDREDLIELLDRLNLLMKRQWYNYVFLPKKDYYRLVIFDNGVYGLFTQSQLPIVEKHQDLNSSDWRDYKPYADKDYQVMKDNGVLAGTKTDENVWTTIRKNEFRNSDEWTNFRKNILEWNTNYKNCIICEDCRKDVPTNYIEIHHIFPKEYDVLNRKKFMLLCHGCHAIRTANGE